MPRKRQSTPPEPHRERLGTLRSKFALFRRTHPPRSRIPEHLRQAAVDAVEAGLRPVDVYRATGASSGQLSTWRRSLPAQMPAATIVSLTDDPVPPVPSSAEPSRELEFQFAIGGWRLSLRLDPAEVER